MAVCKVSLQWELHLNDTTITNDYMMMDRYYTMVYNTSMKI